MPSIINATTSTGLVSSADNSGSLQLATNNGTTAVTIDTNQNVGVGVTPSAWRTSFGQKSIQFGPVGFVYSLSASSTNNQTFLGSNWYLNSSGNATYINSDYALNYSQSFGIHNWATAVQGTAGNTFSFTDVMQIDASANLKFNSGYGSAATAYGCRAWVNFNGTGTVAIRASGNVSSITDGGTGVYTVNFTTAMPDANYSASVVASSVPTVSDVVTVATDCNPSSRVNPTTTAFIFSVFNAQFASIDTQFLRVAVFR
jgi:hypothetical protein